MDKVDSILDQDDFIAFIPASEEVTMAMQLPCAHLMDKLLLAEYADLAGLKTVTGQPFASFDDLAKSDVRLPFPVVVKPTKRSFKAFRAENMVQIEQATPINTPIVVQPFLDGPAEAISGIMWDGTVHSYVQERWDRIWPRDCGLAAASRTVAPSPDLVDRLGVLMSGHTGLFSAQFLDGHLIDLNLRVASSLPLAVAAGVNLPAIYCDLISGRIVAPIYAPAGHRFRWISGEVKGVVNDLRNGAIRVPDALRILRPHRGTAHSMFSIRDPLPFLMRLYR